MFLSLPLQHFEFPISLQEDDNFVGMSTVKNVQKVDNKLVG